MRRHISVELKKVVLQLAIVKGYKYKKIPVIKEMGNKVFGEAMTLIICCAGSY